MAKITVEIDLEHPDIRAAIDEEAVRIAAEAEDPSDPWEDFAADLNTLRDSLETARRHVSPPNPNHCEALIYIERALQTLSGIR